MKLSILGTEYTVMKKKYNDIPDFKEKQIDGYCCPLLHEIVIGDMLTFPGWEKETKDYAAIHEQNILRHEIVHAFLNESGLQESALCIDRAWAKNEEMIDWIALIGPKIYKGWQEAGALPQRN